MGTEARSGRRGAPLQAELRNGARADLGAGSARTLHALTARLRRRAILAISLLAALALAGFLFAEASNADPPATGDLEGLVHAENGTLTLAGAPWPAVGFNDYRLTATDGGYVCDSGAGAVSDDQLAAIMDRAKAAGATVIRTWFFQSMWDPGGNGSGDWGPFDRVLEAAAARGIRVVPVLANQWQDCENGAPERDLGFYSGGYREPRDPYALSYLDYATTVAEHYAGSPAIAYWQLINEPEAGTGGACDEAAASSALAGFASDVSGAIRAVDPRHLISLGTIGGGQCGTAGSDYAQVQSAVDVCEIHVYDGADTGSSPTTPMPATAADAISSCTAAGKPVVAGELGFAADLDSAGQSTGAVTDETLADRARFLAARVSAMAQAGLDGFMVWQLDTRQPLSDGADAYAIGPCDPVDTVIRTATGENPSQPAAAEGCGPPAAQGSAA